MEVILVEIDALPAVADRAAARKDDVLLFDESETNLASTITAVRGDIELAFRNAAYTRRERFKVQRRSAVPMEPRGLLAEWDATHDRMTVSGAAKVPFPNRRTPVEGAAEAVGGRAREARRDRSSTGPQGPRRGCDCRPAGHHLGMVPKADCSQIRWIAGTSNPGPATDRQRN